jgi:hypothetical protein
MADVGTGPESLERDCLTLDGRVPAYDTIRVE